VERLRSAAALDLEAQLAAYFDRDLRRFNVPLAFGGTAFQQRVWGRLLEVPYGTTTSYLEIAKALGNPAAVRAVGAANGANPIAVIVPCHRVVGTSGTLTGYAGGLATKEWLLRHEGAVLL
jgi:methylated-DNA-[protein]-cysteine S-methyltransferase